MFSSLLYHLRSGKYKSWRYINSFNAYWIVLLQQLYEMLRGAGGSILNISNRPKILMQKVSDCNHWL